MGQISITSLEELPSDEILSDYIQQAMKLNEQSPKTSPKTTPKKNRVLILPDILTKALNEHAVAQKNFENFSYSNKKEYVVWIEAAKTEKTRLSRLATTIEWLSEGKVKNWKYLKTK